MNDLLRHDLGFQGTVVSYWKNKLHVNPLVEKLLVATRHQSRSQECTCHRRCEKTSSLPTWYGCPPWNPTVPKVDWTFDPETSVPTSCPRNRSRIQDRLAIPRIGCLSPARSGWILPCWPFWRYQLVCNPCQTCDHHAKRYSIGPSHPRRTLLSVFHSSHKATKKIGVFKHHPFKETLSIYLYYLSR